MNKNQLAYRAVAYHGEPTKATRILTGHATYDKANEILDLLLTLPGVTGGHIEEQVQGAGWVVFQDDGYTEEELSEALQYPAQ